MKAIVLALVLTICGDAVFNGHRYTSQVFQSVGTLIHSTSEEYASSFYSE